MNTFHTCTHGAPIFLKGKSNKFAKTAKRAFREMNVGRPLMDRGQQKWDQRANLMTHIFCDSDRMYLSQYRHKKC